jgi:hypothetical protein
MIKNIIDMLGVDEFYGKSDLIEIAKGKYKIPQTPKELIYQTKRKWKRKLLN